MDVCDGDDVPMDGLCLYVHALWIILFVLPCYSNVYF